LTREQRTTLFLHLFMALSERFREWDAETYIPGKQKRAQGRELHPEKGVKGSHTSSQPLVRTTTSSEHNGQRRCLSAFHQTKRNCWTKRKQVLWWSEKEREKESERGRGERGGGRERECLFRELSCVCGRKERGLLRRKRGCSFAKRRGSLPSPSPRCTRYTKGRGLRGDAGLRVMYRGSAVEYTECRFASSRAGVRF
jgi:hypothetical protein